VCGCLCIYHYCKCVCMRACMHTYKSSTEFRQRARRFVWVPGARCYISICTDICVLLCVCVCIIVVSVCVYTHRCMRLNPSFVNGHDASFGSQARAVIYRVNPAPRLDARVNPNEAPCPLPKLGLRLHIYVYRGYPNEARCPLPKLGLSFTYICIHTYTHIYNGLTLV